MTKRSIKFENEEGIGIIVLNKPERMNALTIDLISELSTLIDDISQDDKIGAVILTGNKKAFCAGADIAELSKIASTTKAHAFFAGINSLFNKIETLEKPVIAAVSGFALGGGCELTLACDFRIAANNAIFGLPEIKLGLIPGAGGIQRLPCIIGMTKAKEILYSGESINAKEALKIGLVTKLVRDELLMGEARKTASRFLQYPSITIKMMKLAINAGANMNIGPAIDYEARCAELLLSTEGLKKNINGFIKKRDPRLLKRHKNGNQFSGTIN